MEQSEFVEMYQTLFPKGDAQKFALLTFNSFDKNGDGGVDFKEFICALYITSRGYHNRILKYFMKLVFNFCERLFNSICVSLLKLFLDYILHDISIP